MILKKKCIAIELNVGILLALKYLECNTIWIMQNKIDRLIQYINESNYIYRKDNNEKTLDQCEWKPTTENQLS